MTGDFNFTHKKQETVFSDFTLALNGEITTIKGSKIDNSLVYENEFRESKVLTDIKYFSHYPIVSTPWFF